MGRSQIIEALVADAVKEPTTAPQLEEMQRRIQFVNDNLPDDESK